MSAGRGSSTVLVIRVFRLYPCCAFGVQSRSARHRSGRNVVRGLPTVNAAPGGVEAAGFNSKSLAPRSDVMRPSATAESMMFRNPAKGVRSWENVGSSLRMYAETPAAFVARPVSCNSLTARARSATASCAVNCRGGFAPSPAVPLEAVGGGAWLPIFDVLGAPVDVTWGTLSRPMCSLIEVVMPSSSRIIIYLDLSSRSREKQSNTHTYRHESGEPETPHQSLPLLRDPVDKSQASRRCGRFVALVTQDVRSSSLILSMRGRSSKSRCGERSTPRCHRPPPHPLARRGDGQSRVAAERPGDAPRNAYIRPRLPRGRGRASERSLSWRAAHALSSPGACEQRHRECCVKKDGPLGRASAPPPG